MRWAQFLIIRLLTENLIPRLVESANRANEEFEDTRAHLDGCFVEVDFSFDDTAQASYDALVRSFDSLSTAQRIWDVTQTATVDRVTQRTTAFTAILRTPVRFDFASPEIVRSKYRAMRLGNLGGRDLQIYPGFIMMREVSRDFALIEFAQLDCQLLQSRYIEEETPVPSDAQQVGLTWKRANKDGSQDRRFNNNYQIPIMLYGGLSFSNSTGLDEAYLISSFAKTAAFVQAMGHHKQALLTTPDNLPALDRPTAVSEEEDGEQISAEEPAFSARPRKYLAVDWVVLVLLIAGFGLSVRSISQHREALAAMFTPAPSPVPLPAAPAPQPAAVTTPPHSTAKHKSKAHKRSKHHRTRHSNA